MSRLLRIGLVAARLLAPTDLIAEDEPLAALGDAVISIDSGASTWRLENSYISPFALALDREGAL
jgi:hypothetical protein